MRTIDVAVGVLVDDSNRVLISYRHPDSHQGDLWEFPGGKIEAGESVESALRREFREELGLQIQTCFPLKKISHQYPDKSVILHVRRITEWQGEAKGLEGQEIAWRAPGSLRPEQFPAANAPIIALLNLPDRVAITPQVENLDQLQALFDGLLAQQLPIIQLRQPQLSAANYREWFELMLQRCRVRGTRLLFNGELKDFPHLEGAGFHANSKRLAELESRPVTGDLLFSASCHTMSELRQAEALGTDFVLLSPIAASAKYLPGTELGWPGFRQLIAGVNLPVYALGGVTQADLNQAKASGGQGISGIRLFSSKQTS